ncbi:hypothetical protein [Actinomadura sp. SCN-SB]|uniref:hypothetical protein n=1 Tax=Actinomadura sp. SCN-SB TaxID=3373092 RepID=UPI0037534017
MIRLDRLTRADLDRPITGLYMLAGALPAPTRPDAAALDLAQRLTRQTHRLPDPAQEDR